MAKRVSGCGAGLLATMLAAAALGTGQAARAENDCLAAPNRAPSAGGHWYYHLDRGHDRKCWYLVEGEARAPAAEPVQQPQQSPLAPPVPSAPPAAPPSSIETFFSSLSTGFTGQQSAPLPASQLPPLGTYTTQSSQPDDPAASGTGAPKPHPVHTARRTEADTQPAPKPRHPTHVDPVQVADHPAAPSDQAQRDALFQEFLRWRESR